MKHISLTIFILLFTISNTAGQVGELIWEDNFNAGNLNTEYWTIETGIGVNGDFGTGQIDRATDRPGNISFEEDVPGAEDGCLVITTRKEFYIDRNYTSGRINTSGKKSWGPGHRISARVYPRDVRYMGQGFAFWTMPDEIPEGWTHIMWPQGGEVDIMEYVGAIPYHNLGSVHYAWFWENNQWQSWNHGHMGAYYSYETQQVPIPHEPGYGNYPCPANAPFAGSSGFHTYGIDWYEDRMEFFIDDNVYHIHYFSDGDGFQQDGQDAFEIREIDGRRVAVSEYSHHFEEWYPFEHKHFIILSAGVGGSEYSYGGPVGPEAVFPCSVFIDWVKVYSLEPSSAVDKTTNFDMRLVPNPAQSKLHFAWDLEGSFPFYIQNVSGKQVMSGIISNKKSLDISSLMAGNYLFSVFANKTIHSKVFVKQ